MERSKKEKIYYRIIAFIIIILFLALYIISDKMWKIMEIGSGGSVAVGEDIYEKQQDTQNSNNKAKVGSKTENNDTSNGILTDGTIINNQEEKKDTNQNETEQKEPEKPKEYKTIKLLEEDNFKIQEDLDIFSNPNYNNQKIIMPEAKNTYIFFIENATSQSVITKIKFIETNTENINMKYKIKVGEQEVNATWESATNIAAQDFSIPINNKVPIVIDWYWQETRK